MHPSLENLILAGDRPVDGKGNNKDNALVGNDARNRLTGGIGADTLTGGAARDIFDFSHIADSGKRPPTRDVITDFIHVVDDIDLRTIDASTLKPGNQAFHFIGQNAFHGVAGELHYSYRGEFTLLEADVNGDAKADFQIELTGAKTISAADFVLVARRRSDSHRRPAAD